MFLENWKQMARQHMKENSPKLFQALKQAGTLDATIDQRVEETYQASSALEEAGYRPDEAFEMASRDFLFLKAENDPPYPSNPTSMDRETQPAT